MPIEEKVDFKEYAENYDKYRTADLELFKLAIDRLKIDKTMRILDFGCGTGNYLKAFQEKGYNNLFGLDQSDYMCKIASEKTNATIKKGSHLYIPYEDDFFGAIIIVDVIHFIDETHSLLKSLHRVCKKNGRLFVATQSHSQLESRIYSKYFPSITKIDKLRHPDIINLIAVTESNGFSLLAVDNYLSDVDFLIDENYFNLIKNKSFYILGLVPDDEFNEGIEKFQNDMRNGSFYAKFPGRTLITLEKK